MRIERKISFGKIAYNGIKKINEVTLNVAIYYNDNGTKELAISGSIWNSSKTDIFSGGQNLDTIFEYVNQLSNKDLFLELYYYWKKYHLKKTPESIILRIEDVIEGNNTADPENIKRIKIITTFEE